MSRYVKIGIVLTLVLLSVHLLVIDDYGATWDFHHHFFAGLWHLGLPMKESLTKFLPFTVPDPRGTYDLPFGPIMLIAPTITYQIFSQHLNILAFDNAYNLAVIAWGVGGIFVLFLFLLEAFNFPTALSGFVFLALLPRYVGDLHNNMKDVPQSAAFALAIYTFWRLTRYRRIRDLVFASAAFAIAFNTKVNTLMVPVIAGAWLLLHSKFEARNSKQYQNSKSKIRSILSFLRWNVLRLFRISNFDIRIYMYFLVAPIAAFLLWSVFWQNPVERLQYMFRFFLDNTQNLEVLYFGKMFRSAINVPWHYPFGYLAITTPLPILLLFTIGILWSMFTILFHKRTHGKTLNGYDARIGYVPRQTSDDTRLVTDYHTTSLLLILWFFLPLTRYLNPKIGVIDGIRHFEEVLYPLAAIAAIGFVRITEKVRPIFIAILLIFIIGHLAFSIVSYHPYQISYFNELVGGIRGAEGKFDVEYWGTSQKAAIRWLNANARPNSFVHIVMAGDVAAKYLRPDLVPWVNIRGFNDADYVVVLNRMSFFNRYWGLTEYMNGRKPIFSVTVQNVPLTMIYDNRSGAISRTPQKGK